MYTICTTAEAAARQRELESRLLQKMRTRHLDKITVEELCEPSRISRRAFYHYFPSKEEALEARLDHVLQDFVAFRIPERKHIAPEHRELYRFVLYWHYHKSVLEALVYNHAERKLTERTMHILVQEGKNMPGVPETAGPEYRELQNTMLVVGMYAVIFGWYRQGFCPDAEQIAQMLHRILS